MALRAQPEYATRRAAVLSLVPEHRSTRAPEPSGSTTPETGLSSTRRSYGTALLARTATFVMAQPCGSAPKYRKTRRAHRRRQDHLAPELDDVATCLLPEHQAEHQ